MYISIISADLVCEKYNSHTDTEMTILQGNQDQMAGFWSSLAISVKKTLWLDALFDNSWENCSQNFWIWICQVFYRAMLCMRGTSHGPVSICVCLSVASQCSTKMAKCRITQTTPHDGPGNLVFWRQRSPWNSTRVTPYRDTKCKWGGSKLVTFDK